MRRLAVPIDLESVERGHPIVLTASLRVQRDHESGTEQLHFRVRIRNRVEVPFRLLVPVCQRIG